MPQFMTGINFLWIIAVLGVPALLFGLRAWFGYRTLERDAIADWDYLVSENMHDLRMTKVAYVRAFKKVHAPRAAMYIAVTIAVIALITIPAFALINATLWGFWILMEKSQDYEPGYLVWQFFIFFGLMALWVGVALIAARRYHSRAPGLMRDQIMKEREIFAPETPFVLSHETIHLWTHANNSDSFKFLFETTLGMTGEIEKNWNGSGFDCNVYAGHGLGQICVHISPDMSENPVDDVPWFSRETHPFLHPRTHARHDEAETRYTVIRCMKGVYNAFKAAETDGPDFTKVSGMKTSRVCSLIHLNLDKNGRKIVLDVFLYEEGK